MTQKPVPNLLGDPDAARIVAGDTEAVFLPSFGMIGISLKKDGIEALRRVDNLIVAAAANRTVGIPFLFPFANRLADFRYEVAGRGVTLPPQSLVLRYDENGLPMHGLMWPHLSWEVTDISDSMLSARLNWSHPQGLAVFPYPCLLSMSASIEPGSLTIETSLFATSDIDVPVSFGFHPYFGFDGDRADWHIRLPQMRHLTLDARQIPTGASVPFPGLDGLTRHPELRRWFCPAGPQRHALDRLWQAPDLRRPAGGLHAHAGLCAARPRLHRLRTHDRAGKRAHRRRRPAAGLSRRHVRREIPHSHRLAAFLPAKRTCPRRTETRRSTGRARFAPLNDLIDLSDVCAAGAGRGQRQLPGMRRRQPPIFLELPAPPALSLKVDEPNRS